MRLTTAMLLLAAGCSVETSGLGPASTADGGTDATADVPGSDGSADDVGVDAPVDASSADAGTPDSSVDAPVDAGSDVPIVVAPGPCDDPTLIHCFLFDGDGVDAITGRTLSGDFTFIAGIRGQAARFTADTAPAMLDVPRFPASYTLELWFRVDTRPPSDGSGRSGIVDQDGSMGLFAYRTGESDEFRLGATGSGRSADFDRVGLSEWHHIVLVHGPDGFWGYLDGDEVRSSLVPASSDLSTLGPLFVGSNSSDGSDRLDGAIDHVRLWGRVFSAPEARALFDET